MVKILVVGDSADPTGPCSAGGPDSAVDLLSSSVPVAAR